MSISGAVLEAAQEVLQAYLAPELAEKLAREILQRARPHMEESVQMMVGFDLGKPAARPKVVRAAAPKRTKDKAKVETTQPNEVDAAAS